jgi:thiol-disulfide isomerase/thioredoxin
VSVYFSGKLNKNTPIKFLIFLFIPFLIFKLFNYAYFPFILILLITGILTLVLTRSNQKIGYKLPSWFTVISILLFFLFSQPLIVEKEGFGYNENGDLINTNVIWDYTKKTDLRLPNHILYQKDDTEIDLINLKGKTYFITFWATWCAPCMREKLELEKLKKEFSDKPQIQFIDVSFDGKDKNRWLKYLEKKGPLGLQLISESQQETSRKLNFEGIPMHFIANPEGVYKEYRSLEIAKNILKNQIKK